MYASFEHQQKCNNCNTTLHQKVMDKHIANTKYPCPNHCGQLISKMNQLQHLKECNQIKCMYSNCKFTGTLKEVHHHQHICQVYIPTLQQAFPIHSLVRINLTNNTPTTCIIHGYFENKLHVHRLINGISDPGKSTQWSVQDKEAQRGGFHSTDYLHGLFCALL